MPLIYKQKKKTQNSTVHLEVNEVLFYFTAELFFSETLKTF